ncbi:MAG: NAD(P)-binding domain-containing protein [Actinobacteria bacterium]|nr:NAD(P)-binding domain-containing protein [Actinomycetota bacterium]
MSEPIDRGTAIAVIGAGSSGLPAAKNLREYGFEVDVLEREDDLGGNWNFGKPNSRVYRSTHMISSKPFTQYPDFPMPDGFPDYPHHAQVLEYFRRYARHFGLHEVIEFGTSVERVEPVPLAGGSGADESPRWDVTVTKDGRTETRRYAGVVVANGHNWFPKTPSYPGQEDFAGEIIHSADYKDPGVLRGRRVLVVGAGNTGCDIAVEGAQHAEHTYHSTRRGYWYNQKYVFGKPADQVSDVFFGLNLPTRFIQWAFEKTVRMTVGDFARHGLKEPDHRMLETHPIVNQTLLYYVGHGEITPVDDIEHFERDRVVLTDGRAVEVDLVVFCTGYLIRFPFLDEDVIGMQDGRPELYRHVFHPVHDNLFVIGLIQPDSGQFKLVHWQTVAVARYLALKDRDPVRAREFREQVRRHVHERSLGGIEMVDSTRHLVEVEHVDYLRALARLINEDLSPRDVLTTAGAAR